VHVSQELIAEAEIVGRLAFAAILGGAVGFERDMHGHPAGTRTHLLVALGAAVFTVISASDLSRLLSPGTAAVSDPARIAAQIVAGIGFLGAGAIIRYGTSVRGLTTAASLWATAAVGLAVGAREYTVAVAATAIVLLSLGPLNWLVTRYRPLRRPVIRLQIETTGMRPTMELASRLAGDGFEIVSTDTHRVGRGRYRVELEVRAPPRFSAQQLMATLASHRGVRAVQAIEPAEL
jgi:putative Mg2+ transporter-C (MgtC) family protein